MAVARLPIEHARKLDSMEKRSLFSKKGCSHWGRPAVVLAALLLLGGGHLSGQEWAPLWDGRSLEGWESVGDGLWSITPEGYLMGQRDPRKPPSIPWSNSLKGKFNRWFGTDYKVIVNQAWLYTVKEFDEYDLHLEWWLPLEQNSGISIHDQSRGRYTSGSLSDPTKTPAQVAYEIQILGQDAGENPAGSIYMLARAPTGVMKPDQWNAYEIQVRKDEIRVDLNGQEVARNAPLAGRPTKGPIGVQLHDPSTIIMLRNLRIREVTAPQAH